MNDTFPKLNGRITRLERCEDGLELSPGDAQRMRAACERWLRHNDPNWVDPKTFDFGAIRRRRDA